MHAFDTPQYAAVSSLLAELNGEAVIEKVVDEEDTIEWESIRGMTFTVGANARSVTYRPNG